MTDGLTRLEFSLNLSAISPLRSKPLGYTDRENKHIPGSLQCVDTRFGSCVWLCHLVDPLERSSVDHWTLHLMTERSIMRRAWTVVMSTPLAPNAVQT
jgi:hypothetical protein